MKSRNQLFAEIARVLGANPTGDEMRNDLLIQIVQAAGGVVTDPTNRNQLLQDWLDASLPKISGITDIIVCGASIMSAQANTIAIRDALAQFGLDVTVHNRAVGGENLTQIRTRVQAAITEFAGQQSSAMFQWHGGGNDYTGPYPTDAAVMDQGIRDIINDITAAGFECCTSTLSWRAAVTGEDTEPYNTNVYIPVIAELTPPWMRGARPYVDVWTFFYENQDVLSPDGTHPTDPGNYETGLYIGNGMAPRLNPTMTMTTKDVLRFNGSSFGQLDTFANHAGSCEFEINYQLSADAAGSQNIVGGSDNESFLNINPDTNTINIRIAGTFKAVTSALIQYDTDKHKLIGRRVGASVYFMFDGQFAGYVSVNTSVFGFDYVAVRPSNPRFQGIIWGIRTWQGGNRQTGTPVLDLQINQVGSNTQTDTVGGRTLTLNSVNAGTDWETLEDWA